MMPWWVLAVFVLGANFALWGSVGLVRLAESLAARRRGRRRPAREDHIVDGGSVVAVTAEAGPAELATAELATDELTTDAVAVLIPAHNEALVIEESLRSIMALVPSGNVHVVSDGSTDATVEIARATGARVIETRENLGKAGALEEAISRFNLIDRFPVVLLLDADTRVEPGYFAAALPMFGNPAVVAVAGCVRTDPDRMLTLGGNVLVGHRTRIYAISQRALKFGQTWLHANATPIVPGFASMYRAEVLPQMEMNPPGLVIEDFNMTFEVYQKRLGKVGFTLRAVAVTQDPDTFRDYVRQTNRWAVGLWQTVRRHPPRANLFTVMLTLLLLELVTSSVMFVLLPLILIVLALPELLGEALSWPWFGEVHTAVAAHVQLSTVLFGVLVPDYLLTCLVVVLERRPRLLLVGVFFPLMRMLDAAISLYAIPAAWLLRSNGRWKSPVRRPVRRAAGEPGPAGRDVASRPAEPVQTPGPGPSGRAAAVPRGGEPINPSTNSEPDSPVRVVEACHVSR
jgi:biofilm PGA synthesis N-glycosyltransferase PgaC